MLDETITTKEQWYDVKAYKDEIGEYIRRKRNDLQQTSKMENTYRRLYKSIFSGAQQSDEERYTHTQEMYKVYKAALIASSLSGYSALVEVSGEDGPSTLMAPEVKKVMTRQFKSMSLLEKLSGKTLDDWILKGEAIAFIKLKEDKELYRIKEELVDEVSGEKVLSFIMKEIVTSRSIDIQRIDPLDFYVDANDYEQDPRGCVKIVRTWISPKDLLTSNQYPLLSKDDKQAIINSGSKNAGYAEAMEMNLSQTTVNANRTQARKIEVLTFYGDFITSDDKVLSNIKAILVGDQIAYADYNPVSTNRIIYAPFTIDDETHRGISPIASVMCINKLSNRITDMFLTNLDNVSNPIMLVQKGSITLQQATEARAKRFLEYNAVQQGSQPTFWQPPLAAQFGLPLMEMVLNQSKNTLGLNTYLTGDNTGVVRTARESSILFQAANTRMRVETDAFSYNFMLKLFVSFYAFNRELAFAADEPLDPIYLNPELRLSISTNASRADIEGEFNKLMQILGTPIGQMIFANLNPEQIVMAVRYIMAKAELTDADNLLQLTVGLGDQQNAPVPMQQQQAQIPQTQGTPNPQIGPQGPQGGQPIM